jgi:predicted phage terminase large subunit-like protein
MNKNPEAVQWDMVHFPAIRVDLDNVDDPREIGDALWPLKYDLKALSEIKASTTPRGWSAVYQQDPVAGDGNLFNEAMFDFCDLPGGYDWSFIMADTAYKEKQENDFTVFTAFGVKGEQLYVLDVFSKQIKSSELENAVEPFVRRFIDYGYRGTYIEPKGHGIYLNQAWAKKGLMIPSEESIKLFYNDRHLDKVQRANNVVPHLAQRKIYISNEVRNKEGLVAQCLGFPKTKHDDFVDTLIDGIKMCYGRAISILDVL